MKRKFFVGFLVCAVLVGCLGVFVPQVWATVTWTYNAGTNTATASGSGSTNFAALVAADTAGGWGIYSVDASGYVYTFNGYIVLGDGTNDLTIDEAGKTVNFGVLLSSTTSCLYVKNHVVATFGILDDSVTKSTSKGVFFIQKGQGYGNYHKIIQSEDGGVVNLYSCSFMNPSSSNGGYIYNIYDSKIYNTVFVYGVFFANLHDCELYNVAQYKTDGVTLDSSVSVDQLKIISNDLGLVYSVGTVKNVFIRNSGSYEIYTDWADNNLTLINPNFDQWRLHFRSGNNVIVTRQYEFDLSVLNGEITDFVEDANVTLTKNGVKIGSWLTNSSGQIDTQTLTYGFYNETGGNTMYEGSYPFVLTVTHADWANYTSRFYVTEKTKMTISMQEVVETTPDPAVYMTIDDGTNVLIAGVLLAVFGAVVFLVVLRKRE